MNSIILQLLAVGLGGAIGSVIRYSVSLLLKTAPIYATLTVNLLGSLLLGFLIATTAGIEAGRFHWKLMLTVGFCGGFTTFSTFSVQTMQLLQSDKFILAFGNILMNALGCIFLSFLGYWIGKLIVPAS